MSLNVHFPQLVDVHTRHLVRIHVNDLSFNSLPNPDLFHAQWEQHVQEQNLVRPDDPLLLALRHNPSRPLVTHIGNTITEVGTQFRNTVLDVTISLQTHLELWRQEVLDQPEVHLLGCRFTEGSDHDLQEAFVQMSRRQGEDVDSTSD